MLENVDFCGECRDCERKECQQEGPLTRDQIVARIQHFDNHLYNLLAEIRNYKPSDTIEEIFADAQEKIIGNILDSYDGLFGNFICREVI